jgi:putative transcriptional regulator
LKDLSIVSDDELENFYKKVSENVKYYRNIKNKPQLDLVLEMGLKSTSFYSKCENSKDNHHFNLEHLYKISRSLDIPLEEFIKIK